METTSTKTTKAAPTAAAGKNTKPAKRAKPAPKAKADKPRAPKPELVVFAFRLPIADRDLIHKAAGPGKATRFVLAAALAAANGDEQAFKTLVEGRANQK